METINAIEYQKACLRTAGTETGEELLLNGVLGLSGESGEVADLYKKHRFQGHDLDKEDIINELGDCMWYLAILAESLGVTLGDVMQANILKLEKRYPEGFDPERSVNREKEINDYEKQILTCLREKSYEWIVRDNDGTLVAFKQKPPKEPGSEIWGVPYDSYTENIPRHILNSVQWADSEPTNIAKLLRIKEE